MYFVFKYYKYKKNIIQKPSDVQLSVNWPWLLRFSEWNSGEFVFTVWKQFYKIRVYEKRFTVNFSLSVHLEIQKVEWIKASI